MRSEVGHGMTMCPYLPRHYGDAGDADLLAELGEAPRARRREIVLVVDDEPTVLMLATEVLEDLGYKTIRPAMARPDCASCNPIRFSPGDIGVQIRSRGLAGELLADLETIFSEVETDTTVSEPS